MLRNLAALLSYPLRRSGGEGGAHSAPGEVSIGLSAVRTPPHPDPLRPTGAERETPTIWQDQRGAALIYVTVMIGVLVGFAALAVDVGRITTTHTQARSAAEAAALAAASQLDGTGDAITRATNAAMTTPLVQNQQNLAQSPGTVTIAGLRFLNGLPAGTPSLPSNPSVLDPFVTNDPLEARFVEATTQVLTQTNMFAQAIGGGPTTNTRASAVAGFTQVVCKTVPLAVCNPAEANTIGAPFDIAQWKGRQVLVKASGPGSAWVPGDFGLVDVAGVQSAPEIANALASIDPDVCVNSVVDLKPGQTQGARNALNTRFDMYENPFFGANERTLDKYRPARNVTKGLVRTSACSYAPPEPGAKSMALPRDANLVSSTTERFGNGTWDCLSYWNTMHDGEPLPSTGCTNASTPSDYTRYEMYRYEIDNAAIPDYRTETPVGEYGGPMCSTVTPTDDPDRRMLVFAVINCVEHGPISGNSAGPIPVEAFVKAFMTEPTGSPPEVNTYLEIVDVARPGADDGILHDLVQLYR